MTVKDLLSRVGEASTNVVNHTNQPLPAQITAHQAYVASIDALIQACHNDTEHGVVAVSNILAKFPAELERAKTNLASAQNLLDNALASKVDIEQRIQQRNNDLRGLNPRRRSLQSVNLEIQLRTDIIADIDALISVLTNIGESSHLIETLSRHKESHLKENLRLSAKLPDYQFLDRESKFKKSISKLKSDNPSISALQTIIAIHDSELPILTDLAAKTANRETYLHRIDGYTNNLVFFNEQLEKEQGKSTQTKTASPTLTHNIIAIEHLYDAPSIDALKQLDTLICTQLENGKNKWETLLIQEHANQLVLALRNNADIAESVKTFTDNCALVTKHSKLNVFARTVAIVGIALLGFALGLVAGGLIGIAAGAWTGPGSMLTAFAGMLKGSLTGATLGVSLGTFLTGTAATTIGTITLFKQAPFEKALAKVSSSSFTNRPG